MAKVEGSNPFYRLEDLPAPPAMERRRSGQLRRASRRGR